MCDVGKRILQAKSLMAHQVGKLLAGKDFDNRRISHSGTWKALVAAILTEERDRKGECKAEDVWLDMPSRFPYASGGFCPLFRQAKKNR